MRAGGYLIVGFMAFVFAGCTSESAEERICEAANGCGALASDDVQACMSTLAGIDADRALTECADCLEANTCAQIAAGACTAACAPFAAAFGTETGSGVDGTKRPSELTPAERTQFCTWSLEQSGGPGAMEACGSDITVTNGTVSECASEIGQITCSITVDQMEVCFEAVNSPCDLFTAPECAMLRGCFQT